MRKLKITGVLRTVLLVLTVTGILLFFLLTAMDRRKLQRTVDDTIAFARARIQRYEDFNTNDKVKRLIRLLDKSTELSRVITAEGIPDQEKLDRYVEDQRLSGVLILDENMRVVLQNSQDGDNMPVWENQINGAYVRDILKHPEETYSTRLRNEGILYDFAAVARQDAPGLLITYIKKEEISQENGDLTMDTLFAGFHFQMDGALVVSDGTRVVATNVEKLLGKQVSECRELYREQYRPDFGNIVCLHSGRRVWYGSRQNTRAYELYVFIPSGQAFMARNVVCGGYVLLAVLLYMFFVLCKNHTEKENLERQIARLGVGAQVRLLGRIEHQFLPPYYHACDLFTTASLSEMNSISMLEAMASGLYVLQRLDLYNKYQINPGVSGNFFTTREEFAALCREQAGLSAQQKAERRAGVEQESQKYGKEEFARRVLDVYQRAVLEYRGKQT